MKDRSKHLAKMRNQTGLARAELHEHPTSDVKNAHYHACGNFAENVMRLNKLRIKRSVRDCQARIRNEINELCRGGR